MSGEKTHGPEVFIEGWTMKAWAEVSPTITEAAVNFIVLLIREKRERSSEGKHSETVCLLNLGGDCLQVEIDAGMWLCSICVCPRRE